MSSIATDTARPFLSSWALSSSVIESPTRTTFSQSALSVAPMSIHRSFILGTCFRSSSVSRWIGLRLITPATGPVAVQIVTRAPISWIGSQPPIGWTETKPSESMYCTIRPIWSQWPASSIRWRPAPLLPAITLPWESVVSVSAEPLR